MLPIRLRQFPALIRQNAQKYHLLMKTPARQPTFHVCYFSCASHFKLLYCALHSLTVHVSKARLQVHLFCDEEQPMSDAQMQTLKALVPGLQVKMWAKCAGWGATQIGSIWQAYADASASAHEEDWVVKVDSDVFFFNDTIFRAVERSDADMVGDGHYEDFAFCQGGCQFIRVKSVRRISGAIASLGMEKMLEGIFDVAEDVAATLFARKLGLKIWMTWIMMFPDEIANARRLNAWAKIKFSALHYVGKNKAFMLEAYERELYGGKAPDDYSAALLVQ